MALRLGDENSICRLGALGADEADEEDDEALEALDSVEEDQSNEGTVKPMNRTKRQPQQTTSPGGEISGRARKTAQSAENSGRPRCGEPKPDGSTCRGFATIAGKCPMHTKKISEAERQLWRLRGRHAQEKQKLVPFPECDFSTEEGCRRVLELAGDAVLKGKLPNSSAQALAKLASVGLKAAELGVARRLAAIEREIKDRSNKHR